MSNDKNETLITPPRRQFLGQIGLMGAGAVLASCAPSLAAHPNKTNLDVSIMNFALNLEYLEAAFYLAAVGRLSELSGTSVGGNPAPSHVQLPSGFTGASPVPGLDGDELEWAHEIASDELAHVKALRQTITAKGGAPVAQPVINLNTSFTTAGSLASNGAITNFNPFANELFFLHGAFVFEDVGVTAYKGAARYIFDDGANGVLEAAAGILAVEAYHAGLIRARLYQLRGEQAAAGLTVAQVVQAISNLRDSVDGATDVDQGILGSENNTGRTTGISNVVPTDANGIAYSRTPRQVANIVALSGSTTFGTNSFFPNGLSGNFSTLLSL